MENEVQKKEIEAFIQATILETPQLKDKLTTPIVWNYLQLPDSSFGWAGKEPMPRKLKLLVIAAHMKLGAPIGYGHIYFLGNKLYQSADFVRSKAAHDPRWKMMGRSTYRPHTEAERGMFCLKPSDMSCRLEIEVEHNGQAFVAEGDGIIGEEEIKYKSKYGKPKAGLDSAKNRAMSLKTRALRDLYARCYPVHDLPVAPDINETIAIEATSLPKQMELANDYKTSEENKETRDKIQDTAKIEAEKEIRIELVATLEHIKKSSKHKKIKTKDIVNSCGAKTMKEIEGYDNDTLSDALEAMSDFIDNLEDVADTKQLEEPKTEPKEVPHNPVEPSPMDESKKTPTHEEPKQNSFVKAALKKYEILISDCEKIKLLPTKILGFNHLNVFEYDKMKMINDAISKLETKLKEPIQTEEMNVDDIFGVDENESDPAAVAQLDELLGNEKIKFEPLIEALKELKTVKLLKGDAELILKNARLAIMKKDVSDILKIVFERK